MSRDPDAAPAADHCAPLVLPARLDLTAAAPLTEALKARAGAPAMVLDGSDVTHLGALCLQALLSAAESARRQGQILSLAGCSDRMEAHLAAMGLGPADLTVTPVPAPEAAS